MIFEVPEVQNGVPNGVRNVVQNGISTKTALKSLLEALGTLLDALRKRLGGLWGQILQTPSASHGSRRGPGAGGTGVGGGYRVVLGPGGRTTGGRNLRLIAIRN